MAELPISPELRGIPLITGLLLQEFVEVEPQDPSDLGVIKIRLIWIVGLSS
jgi:hypothetical protein